MSRGRIPMQRDGYAMVVLPRYRAQFDRLYAEGEIFEMEGTKPRTEASHNHYFAAINEAWNNLPEELTAQYPTPEHLRKRALIKTGYCTMRDVVLTDEEAAKTVAAFISKLSEYDVVIVRGNVVRVYSPRSQSVQTMDGDEFRKSKQDVLNAISEMIGVTRKRLEEAAKRGAA